MSNKKVTIYKIEQNNVYNQKKISTEVIVGLVVYAAVLMIASSLFEGFYVENFIYAIIAALLLNLLNITIKPTLVLLTLPLSIVTLGIAYPIVNVILLKLCDFIMGRSFEISGLVAPFIIAVFISVMKIILDSLITKKVGK
jgi:putative membrane protein